MIRLALDGTPLLGPRSGIGEVVGGIAPELARRDEIELVAYALTWRGRHDLVRHLPPGARAATRPIPARLARQAWLRTDHPAIERWTGAVDVVHATNYVGPPTRARLVVSVYDLGFIHEPAHVAADALEYPELLRRAIRRGRVDPHDERPRPRGGARGLHDPRRARRPRLSGRPAGGGRRPDARTSRGGTRPLRVRDRHHRATQELPRAHPGVRRVGRPRPGARPRHRRHARLGNRRVRRRDRARPPPRPNPHSRLRVDRRSPRPPRGCDRAGLSVAPRGIRLPTARSDGGPRARGRGPRRRDPGSRGRRRPARRSRRRRRAGRCPRSRRARRRHPPGAGQPRRGATRDASRGRQPVDELVQLYQAARA